MIIRPYGSEKLHKPKFETFYEVVKINGVVKSMAYSPGGIFTLKIAI